jgi:hypothetical protein
MSNRLVLLTMMTLGVLCVGLVLLKPGGSARIAAVAPQQAATQKGSPMRGINKKALAAKSGDEAAVRALADEISSTLTPAEIPAAAVEQMKERLVRAEISYRTKGKGSVTEANIAKMLNKLFDKAEAPAYARVITGQVRVLRAMSMNSVPSLISQETVNPKKAVGSSVKREMSPLEGAYLALLLLQQKMNNPFFQQTPDDWKRDWHSKQVARWEAARRGGGNSPAPAESGSRFEMSEADPKVVEMGQVMARAGARASRGELPNLADTAMDDLGVAK